MVIFTSILSATYQIKLYLHIYIYIYTYLYIYIYIIYIIRFWGCENSFQTFERVLYFEASIFNVCRTSSSLSTVKAAGNSDGGPTNSLPTSHVALWSVILSYYKDLYYSKFEVKLYIALLLLTYNHSGQCTARHPRVFCTQELKFQYFVLLLV